MLITTEFLKQIAPKCDPAIAAQLVAAMNEFFPKYRIDTTHRIAMFLAQAVHESAGLTRFVENLMYTKAESLLKTFPKDFKDLADATKYVRQPQRIANRVYANQGGNGPESSGEGWLYRGRGIFQLTLKSNYIEFDKDNPAVGALKNPDLLMQPRYAVLSACWYWLERNLNKYADIGDIVGCSRAVNGGRIGLKERMELYTFIKTNLGKQK